MKRWALFLVLFLAGLAILWWVDRRMQPAPKPEDMTAPPPEKGVLTEFPDEKGHTVLGLSRGELIANTFDSPTGKLLYRITAKNHESLGEGVYRMDSLVLKIYVRGTDTLRMELAADTARAKLKIDLTQRGGPSVEFDPAYVMQFDGVVATLHEGSPFVPLTLRVPHLEGSLGTSSFRSDDRVEVTGEKLSADGVGLSYDGIAKELKLARDTHANLTLPDGTPAKLSAAGGLTITSLGERELGLTRSVARDHAQLTFEGKEPIALDADEVTLDAQVTRTDSDTAVQPSRVGARGNVRLSPRDGTFFGDQAELELDLDGRPKHAQFKGAPRVELVLRDVDASAVPGALNPKSTDLPVEMLGDGPLDLWFGGSPHFDFLGPATLLLPSLAMDLTAQEKLSGARTGDGPFGRLEATGASEAHAVGATIQAPALTLERKLLPDGTVTASLAAQGDTHAFGPLEGGGTFDLTARRGMDLVRTPKSFQVPFAHDVELTVTGADAFHAKADEVSDLDYQTRSMIGVGGVLFENADGRGTGQRVVAKSRNSVEVFGAPSALAHLEFEQGTLDAESITFQDDRLRAEGNASATVGEKGAEYKLASRWIEVQRRLDGDAQDLGLEAGGQVEGSLSDAKRELSFTADHLQARAFSATPKTKKIESRGLEADGSVVFHVRGDEWLDGNGERLVIEPDRSGRLFPATDRRVVLSGKLPKDELEFAMSAGTVHFAPQSLSAEDPAIEIKGVAVPVRRPRAPAEPGASTDPTPAAPLHVVAGAMSIDPTSMLFTEGVYVGQTETPESTWSLDSENLVLTGALAEDGTAGKPRFEVASVIAWGGFQAHFADQVLARGTTLLLDRLQNRLTMRGEPSEFDVSDWRVKTKWLEVDLTTGFWRASKGSAYTLNERSGSYEFRFESMEPMKGVDSRIEVVREPSFVDLEHQRETRAAWALFWLDETRLGGLTTSLLSGSEFGASEPTDESEPAAAPAAPSGLVRQLQSLPFLKWVREAYFEGNIEVLDHGERHLSIGSLYVDLADGHGWIRDFIMTMDTPFKSASKHLKLHADWMSFDPNGSARATNAVATSCEFDEPHYEITLGDLRIKPKAPSRNAKTGAAEPSEGYDVRSKNNSVKIGKSPKVPIPEIAFPTDAKFRVPPESLTFFGVRGLSFGNIAKFGAFLGFTFDFGLGSASKAIGRVLAGSSEPPKGHNTANVKYLNKRGLLLNGENSIELPGVYKLDTRLAIIGDNGRDRGLVRVPESERDMLRTWLRLEGRRWLGKSEWFDLNLTKQSDPGVQAEFFEREFVRWEQRETYVHYRKARGLNYWRGTVEAQLDDHRTEVLEEPSLGYTRARGPAAHWWGSDVVYTSDSTVAHLRRVEPPFKTFNEPPFRDTFGEQEVVRLDTLQRLERPIALDVLDARLVPFVEARGTAWDRSPVGSESPTRFGLFGGAEISATFWRMYNDGDLHTLTPTIGFRTDLAFEENGDRPAQFDGVEDPTDGQFTEFGLRSSWVMPLDPRRPDVESRFLDVEVREAYGTHLRDPSRTEGWQPLRINGRWLTEIEGVPFGATHDARYDLDANETTYSRSAIGVRPLPPLELETSFNTARDLAGDRLYSAWKVSARYNYSEKWQFEGSETISTLSGSELGSNFTMRRIGHDFIVEIEYSFTAGEGGSSISLNLLPLLLYREHSLGLLKPMQAQGN